MSSLITPAVLARTMDFDAYMALTKTIVENPDYGGMYANPKTHRYTRSNLERMNKVLQFMVLSQKLYNTISDLKEDWVWLVLSEPWCGDASWGTPALYIIAQSSEKIDFRILLRDENPEIMKAYQTAGTDSIPKLICLRKSDLKELGNWGPRPKLLQDMIDEQKKNPDVDYRAGVRALHTWYEHDMTKSIQDEMIDEVRKWKTTI